MMPTHPPARSAATEPRSEKILPWHTNRLAVVYVRQSTAQQVLDHQESTRLQYGLTRRAEALGWAPDRIVVIDDDLGKSGTSIEGRGGFQRLVSEVSLDHVGSIFGIEMSRLARSNADWHRLLDRCALFRTLIADLDGIDDPVQYNDRLLLGLKGTMSEAEVHILKQRMHQGRLSKARRGALTFALPIGYVWQSPGAVGFDPDEQVQAVVRLIFRTFDELGTRGGVLRYLAQHDIRLGVRVREGQGKGALVWRRPNRMTLQLLLKHPLYAGAYVYGRRQIDPRRYQPSRPRTGRVVCAPDEWLVLLRDRVPAYISWEQYEANQARLAANRARAETMGATRDGAALLAGLVVCGRCGYHMGVHYSGAVRRHTDQCTVRRSCYGGPLCQHLPGACLDDFVSAPVLAALEPVALDLSLAAIERMEQERADLQRLWQQRVERARYDADRAARQYYAVEPENRLVVRTLERAWEEKLAALERLEEEHHRFLRQQPRLLTAGEREAIRQLAADIPALWAAPDTTSRERKEIIRQVVDRVVVQAEGTSEQVQVRIVWVGGGQTDGVVRRSVAQLARLRGYPQLCQRVADLTRRQLSAPAIAQQLEEEGYTSARVGNRLGAAGVRTIQERLDLRGRRVRPHSRNGLGPQEWWVSELVSQCGVARSTIHHWLQQGWLRARREEAPQRRWIIWADAAEVERLRAWQQRSVADKTRQRWTHPAPSSARPCEHAADSDRR